MKPVSVSTEVPHSPERVYGAWPDDWLDMEVIGAEPPRTTTVQIADAVAATVPAVEHGRRG
jgi:hypothetical protein